MRQSDTAVNAVHFERFFLLQEAANEARRVLGPPFGDSMAADLNARATCALYRAGCPAVAMAFNWKALVSAGLVLAEDVDLRQSDKDLLDQLAMLCEAKALYSQDSGINRLLLELDILEAGLRGDGDGSLFWGGKPPETFEEQVEALTGRQTVTPSGGQAERLRRVVERARQVEHYPGGTLIVGPTQDGPAEMVWSKLDDGTFTPEEGGVIHAAPEDQPQGSEEADRPASPDA